MSADDLARAKGAGMDCGVRLISAASVPLEPVRWVWPMFLPAGMLTILGGAPGCGKTTLAMSLAAIYSSGGWWPCGSKVAAPGDVAVWTGEDTHAVLASRLKAAGANMRRVHFIGDTPDGEAFDPGRDVDLLEAAVAQMSDLRILVVDPIVSAVAGDSNKSAEVRRGLQPLVMLAQRVGCAVLGITHFSKGTSGREPVERITGSLAFGAAARMVLVASKCKPEAGETGEPRRVFVRAKSNVGPDSGGFAYSLDRIEVAPEVEGQRVVWGEHLDGSARELLNDAEHETEGDVEGPGDVAQWLRELLTSGSMPSREVKRAADDAGYSWRTVQRAMRRAGVDSQRGGFGKAAEWFLIASRATVAPSAPRPQVGANGATGATGDDAEVI